MILRTGVDTNIQTEGVLQTAEDVSAIPYSPTGIAGSLQDLATKQPGRPLWVAEFCKTSVLSLFAGAPSP